MQPMGADSFRHYRCPFRLRLGPGKRLAFLVKQANIAANHYNTNLWLHAGGNTAPLTHHGDVGSFWWKGDSLVFTALRTDLDRQQAGDGFPLTVLYCLNPTQPGEAAEWVRLAYCVEDIAFLPQSDNFLFTAKYHPQTQAILGNQPDVASAIAALKASKNCAVITEVPFWENGEGLCSGQRTRLYLYQNGHATPLTDEHTSVEQLRLAPDGKTAFFTARHYTDLRPYPNRLMRLDIATGTLTDISVEPAFIHEMIVPMDGERVLVFGSNMQQYGLYQNNRFTLVAPNKITPLGSEEGYETGDLIAGDIKPADDAHWVAHGRMVYWNTTTGSSSHLMSIHTGTGKIQQLTHVSGAVMELAAGAGGIYFTGMRGQGGPEVYALEQNGGERPVTALNTALENQYLLSVPQKIRAQGENGNIINGFVMKPAQPFTGKCPAVLYIHGGPKLAFGSILQHEMQMLAGLGYAVLFCNPCGSAGQGNAFADIRGRYGLADYADVIDFLNAVLAANPWIDENRIGVAGGSYGGYLVNWMIGHTQRFATAISQRGIAHWATMATTSDIGYFLVPDQAGASIWEDPLALWEQSPLKYAPNAVTPTLFLHSEEDYRCPVSESMQMFTALKLAGTPARLCVFKGENHNLSRSGTPAQRIRRLQEIADWLGRYLAPTEEENPVTANGQAEIQQSTQAPQ